ncbi:hypothetical protein, partial [Aromatoleum evansii]|uniref:hypothetical protein n=1 Tax=Aromatoleum evansii TaxID=59406 RepID=UPI00145CA6B3
MRQLLADCASSAVSLQSRRCYGGCDDERQLPLREFAVHGAYVGVVTEIVGKLSCRPGAASIERDDLHDRDPPNDRDGLLIGADLRRRPHDALANSRAATLS